MVKQVKELRKGVYCRGPNDIWWFVALNSYDGKGISANLKNDCTL